MLLSLNSKHPLSLYSFSALLNFYLIFRKPNQSRLKKSKARQGDEQLVCREMTSIAVTQPTSADGAQLAHCTSGMTLTPNPGINPYHVNLFRISAVIDRLSLHVGNRDDLINDDVEFENLCLSLSRGIDFAITNHQPVDRKHELPSLIKQVSQHKKDYSVLGAIMVLMISIKNACNSGWFSGKESAELKNLVEEIGKTFSSVPNDEADPSCSLSVISTIMSRFYPRIELGDMLLCFEVKPGFDAYAKDFFIKKKKTPPLGNIRLLVVQTDKMETSSCLVTPAKVNFLLNGKGVPKRVTLSEDNGPQTPTMVSHLLKYGSNLLQAVGEFTGNYIIAVAYMSETRIPDSSSLQEYEHHAPMSVEPDSEVIEGPSRISLNCPISFRRIKTPVKGHSCKHIQCFDFDDFVGINSRRPSWRCPYCSQHVSFTDICIDQKMVQVLKETDTNVNEVIISSDWCWEAVMKSKDATKKLVDEPTTDNGDGKSTKSPDKILDLTQTDDVVDMVETEDRKHPPTTGQTQSMTTHGVDDFWIGLYASTLPDSNLTSGTPVLTQPSPILQHEPSQSGAIITASVSQNSSSSLADQTLMPLNQSGNVTVSNEYGRFPSVPAHITRVPNTVQALPSLFSVQRQKSEQNSVNTCVRNPAASQAMFGASMRPPISMLGRSPLGISQTSTQSLHHHTVTQQNRSHPVIQPIPHKIVQPGQTPSAYRVPSEHPQPIDHTQRMHRPTSQPQYLPRPPLQSPATSSRPQHHHTGFSHDRNVRMRGPVSGTPHLDSIAAANRTMQMFAGSTSMPNPSFLATNPNIHDISRSRTPSPRGNVGISSQPFSRNEINDPGPAEQQNWRPFARMRGALSGQAYIDALNQFIIRPSQQAQAVRSVVNVNSSPVPNYSNMGPPGMHGGSGGSTQ